jgi:hypothetical protein
MPLPARAVTEILADNLRRRGSVLPVPARRATRWARGLDLPHGGPVVLYTGMMYQLIPSIERLVALSSRFGDTPLARLAGLGVRANRMVNVLGLVARPSARSQAEYDRILADIAILLRSAGVEFGALYEHDLYAGALAWDMGADEAVAAHARRVADIVRSHGVREVITVDPHTTTMLRTVYPSLVDGFDVRVRSYLEVLAERGVAGLGGATGDVVIHDSCVYARSENIIDAPRRLLTAAGLTVREPTSAGRQTWCCGGPAEALFPARAAAVAASRVAQLGAVAPDCVTMCPICLVNLRKAAPDGSLRVRDIAEYLTAPSVPPVSSGASR